MTLYIGVDFHPHQQTVAYFDEQKKLVVTKTLVHQRDNIRSFYSSFPPAVVGIEATGATTWFETLLFELGHTLQVGAADEIRRQARSRHKSDRRDAELILELLRLGQFPALWRRSAASRQVLELLRLRHSLVKQRTAAFNHLQALRLSCGLAKQRLTAQTARPNLLKLELSFAQSQTRAAWLAVVDQLTRQIAIVEEDLAQVFNLDEDARRLTSHFGVGALTALCFAHTLGEARRFANKRKVVAYLGLDPVEDSSAKRRRIGSISKRGSPLLRFLLGQAAQSAARRDAELKRIYREVSQRRGKPIAKVAIARHLAVRLFKMLRYKLSYAELTGEAKPSVVG